MRAPGVAQIQVDISSHCGLSQGTTRVKDGRVCEEENLQFTDSGLVKVASGCHFPTVPPLSCKWQIVLKMGEIPLGTAIARGDAKFLVTKVLLLDDSQLGIYLQT